MKTPQELMELTLVELVIANVESLARMCRGAPRAKLILDAAALKLREEYPDVGKEGADA